MKSQEVAQMEIPPTTQTSTLIITRIVGSPELRTSLSGGKHPHLRQVRVPEPTFQIILDGSKIGTIKAFRYDSFFNIILGPAPITRSSRFVIQAGHHDLLVTLSKLQEFAYTKLP